MPLVEQALLAMPRSWKWWEYLKPFGLFHWVTILAFLLAARALCRRGAELRGTPAHGPYRRTLGWTVLIAQVIADLIQFRTADSLKTALPLQACDLAAYGAAALLLVPSRRLHAILFFWGFGFCTQALITPRVREGFLHPAYWYYWGVHAMILMAGGWAITVDRFRPRLRDVGFASFALLLYSLGAIAVNEVLGANYGFAGRTTPKFRTLIEELGPWPWRIVQMYAMAVGMFFVMWAVYVRVAARRAAKQAAVHSADSRESVRTAMREGA